jgi:hypothetical protein
VWRNASAFFHALTLSLLPKSHMLFIVSKQCTCSRQVHIEGHMNIFECTENDHNFEYDKITIVVDNLPLNRWGKYPLQSSFKSKHPGNLDNRIPKKLRESRKVKSSSLATCMYMIFDPLYNILENQHYVGPYPDIFERVRSAWYRLKVIRPETISACPPSSG